MQCSLNFSDLDKKELLALLKACPKLELKSKHELLRCRMGEATATLYGSGKLLIQGNGCEEAAEKILAGFKENEELVFGVDETGRGEPTGPFVIAGVLGKANELRRLRDSKKLKGIGEKAKGVQENALGFAVLSVGSRELSELHEKGVSMNEIEARAINAWLALLKEMKVKARFVVDGSPIKGVSKGIEFLPKADDLNPVVGAASVMARSVRDQSRDNGKRKGWGSWGKRK